jgi:hypothetical protein
VQNEWSKHQKLAVKELKHGLASYCDIGLYNLKIQIAILEKLQVKLQENLLLIIGFSLLEFYRSITS